MVTRLMDFALTDEQKLLRDNIVRFAQRGAQRGRSRARPRAGLLARAVAQVRRDRHPGPAGAEEYGGSGARSAHLRDRARGARLRLPRRRAGVLAVRAPAGLRGAALEARQRRAEAALSARPVRRHADRRARDDRARLGLRRVRVAHHAPSATATAFASTAPRPSSRTARWPTWSIVFAMTDPARAIHGGVTGFLVERGTPGFTAGQKFEKMGLRTSPIGELVFEDVYVPAEAVLGGGRRRARPCSPRRWTGSGSACSPATSGRWSGCSRPRSPTRARARSSARPSGSSRRSAHRIADMKVQLEAARLLVYRAAWRLEQLAQRVAGRVDRQAVRQRVAGRGGARRGADPRRLRLHDRVRGRARAARRRRQHDLFGHVGDAAEHHRALAGALARPIGGPFRLEKRRFSRRSC